MGESEILDGILTKLVKDKDKYQKQLDESKLKIRVYDGVNSLMHLLEGLDNKIQLLTIKIEEIDLQINVLETEKNGNASMDKYITH